MDKSLKVSINEYLPLRDLVYKAVKDAIQDGKFLPGERLMENQLAESIGVSRTPIREALRMLELEDFVVMFPRKGAVVKVIGEKDIRDVLEIRANLEALAARLACRGMNAERLERLRLLQTDFVEAVALTDLDAMARRDTEFHDALFDAAGNSKLVQIINQLRNQIYRYRIAYLKDGSSRAEIIREHEIIMQAMTDGDEEASATAAFLHIKNQEEAVIRSWN